MSLLMLKRCLLTVLLLAGVSLGIYSQDPSLKSRYTQEHPLVYTDAWDLWPYVFLDESGNPTGYNVELLKMIFEELDIPYEIHLKPTERALEDLFEGRATLMLGMVASFHDHERVSYGKNVIQLFTHSVAHPREVPATVHGLEDLSKEQVIVHTGSFSHHLMMDHGWGDNALPQDDMDKAIQLVSTEGHGQVLWNTMSLKWLMYKYHTGNLVLDPVDMPSGDYRFMSSDPQLLKALDDTYSRLKAENRLHPLERKWFYPEDVPEAGVPRWIWLVVAGIGLVALILILSSLFYHFRERRLTREGRQRNTRLALILKTCKVNIWVYDVLKKSFIWYGNDARAKRTYTRDEFATYFIGDGFQQVFSGIERLMRRDLQQLRLQVGGRDIDDRQPHTYLINLSVLHADHTHPTAIIGTEIDVSDECERQQHAEQLMHRYQAVFNNAMVDMVYYDGQGRIVNMNARAQRTFKMPIGEVLKEDVYLSDILDPSEFDISDFDHRDMFYSTLFIDYSTERSLKSRRRKDYAIYELQLVPVYGDNHQLLGAFGSGREVTEVAHTFDLARRGVERLRVAMKELSDNINNINYAMQVGGVRIVSYSPVTHLFTINHRMHVAQYVLTQQRCINLTDSESMGQVMHALRLMDRRLNVPVDLEVRSTLRLSGCKHLWLQIHMFPTVDSNGVVTEYTGICRDTTELKHTEHMLQLETEKAQSIEQVKAQFLHNMCFEIRTPLDVVVKSAEQFEQQHTPEEEERFIADIKTNSAYLLKLINDILFLSRLDANMVEINVSDTDFAQVFEGFCVQAWQERQRPEVRYVVESPYNQLVVSIDVANVGRVIGMLVGNAVEHTSKGVVSARYEYIGGKLIIIVEDTSEGISADKLPHIFDRFNGSSGMEGTGLALPISKELVTQLGGTIDVRSEVNKGTTVWVTLPCPAVTIEHKTNI